MASIAVRRLSAAQHAPARAVGHSVYRVSGENRPPVPQQSRSFSGGEKNSLASARRNPHARCSPFVRPCSVCRACGVRRGAARHGPHRRHDRTASGHCFISIAYLPRHLRLASVGQKSDRRAGVRLFGLCGLAAAFALRIGGSSPIRRACRACPRFQDARFYQRTGLRFYLECASNAPVVFLNLRGAKSYFCPMQYSLWRLRR
jgi:hypothetical protein